ncbi:hypothetical protein JTP67_05955 [Streptomyces sp. S12]|nr:hypothetical protein [Streptomyces sp. S12]
MSEPTEDDVNQIVTQAQQLDDWKQQILADMRARGEDTSGVRIIVAHPHGADGYGATEVTRPPGGHEEQPDA